LIDIQSDCITNGPPKLVTHLTSLIKKFIVHGSLSHWLSTIVHLALYAPPPGEGQLGGTATLHIASGCLLLKLLDLLILLLEGDKLNCDPLQFGFQPGSGTVSDVHLDGYCCD
jgi:hypothetical protein